MHNEEHNNLKSSQNIRWSLRQTGKVAYVVEMIHALKCISLNIWKESKNWEN